MNDTPKPAACCHEPTCSVAHNDVESLYYHPPAYVAPPRTVEADLLASYMAVGMTASEAYVHIVRQLNQAMADIV